MHNEQKSTILILQLWDHNVLPLFAFCCTMFNSGGSSFFNFIIPLIIWTVVSPTLASLVTLLMEDRLVEADEMDPK